ncbi:hypothetical protein POSPLADRAFT_1140739 [Postia placenta MAD-698-R-SB12]|uniref:DUF659 domain-containing protein n=1 Tax=Postia placenta MAD-698-R-SB12 TaxID=670580 RepID=A0A1X6N1M8_9APHY|nr:hypothetical protein POSPLADRAFT_1140739 [Postia placenta MAD-698-R-SB12]OSX62531.1 hypothetical protein POSPLADRAFT_1140739 [Postia placenta MAD-698-R-SB12]
MLGKRKGAEKQAGGQKAKVQAKKKKVAKAETKILTDFTDTTFIDSDEEPDTCIGGVRLTPILLKVTRLCRDSQNQDKKWESGAWEIAILGNFNQVTFLMGMEAQNQVLGQCRIQLGQLLLEVRLVFTVFDSVITVGNIVNIIAHLHHEVVVLTAVKSNASKAEGSKASADVNIGSDSNANNNNDPIKAAHEKSASTMMNRIFMGEGRKNLKLRGDRALAVLIACAGISPNIVDSQQFKDFVTIIGRGVYGSPSSTTLRNHLIPKEATYIHIQTIELLKTQQDLTLSFDRGKTRKPKGVYTIHISTPERRVFLMDLNDTSRVSHTANYIVEILQEIIAGVGAERFSGIMSDNTGNTRKAWQLICTMFTHIFNMQDSCYEMNLALGQISELPEFKDVCTSLPYYVIILVISDMRAILAFMNKLTYMMEHFNDAHKYLNITIGLAAIGDTQFTTLTWTTISVWECLPAFRKIVAQRELNIEIVSRNHLFEPNTHETLQFKLSLKMFIAVTSPYAKAIKCLESSLSTASDVFVFWPGIITQLHNLNEYGNLIDAKPDEIHTGMQLRNPRLANLTPGAALNALKSELKAYAKKCNPFSHALREGMSVCKCSDYIKIRQWYHWDPQSTKKALTVSWHNMDETICAPSWHAKQAQDSECGPDIPSSPISADLLEDVPNYKDERRDKFVVSDLVNLNALFLKEILANKCPEVPRPRDKVRVKHVSKASSSDGSLDWDKW